jgi:hypothetical protein
MRETIAGMHVSDVEYTIDAQRIRREKTYVVPQKVLGAPRRVGVTIDLTKGRAIRYETVNNKRYFLEQSIEQYDAILDEATNFAYGTTSYENGVRQLGRYGALTVGNAAVDGVACDVLRLDPPQFNALVHHAPTISVDRSLLARVEPGIPTEVSGFPLRVHVGVVQWGGMPEATKTSRMEQLGDRALRAATRATSRASAVLDTKLDVVTILEGPVNAAAFDAPDGFTAASSFEEFKEKIRPKPGGGGGGFDFD